MGRPAPGLLQRSWPWTPGRPRRWLLRVSERLLRDRPARWTIGSLPIGRTAAALPYGLCVTRRGPTRRRTAQDAEVPLASRSDRFDIAPALPVVTREHRLWRV